MKNTIIFILAILAISCSKTNRNCFVEPYKSYEISKLRDSVGFHSNAQFRKYDMTNLKPIDFIRYLSSVKAFEELQELTSKGYKDKILYTPYMFPAKIKKDWIGKADYKDLLKVICSKQPAIPTMNDKAASFPDELSTVGIEAMHLLYYSEGNDAAYGSNKGFCKLEQQDSLVLVYQQKYENPAGVGYD